MKVAILINSERGKNVADKAMEVLDKYGIAYDLKLADIHRNPDGVKSFVSSTDAEVFICISSLSAALPGVVSSYTKKPVIGVPLSEKLGGLDALLGMTQTPSGAPVATVGVDNSRNAAHLAARILKVDSESVETSPTLPSPATEKTEPSTTPLGGFPMFAPKKETTETTEEKTEKKKKDGWWPSGIERL